MKGFRMSAELLIFVVVLLAIAIAATMLNWLESKINNESDD